MSRLQAISLLHLDPDDAVPSEDWEVTTKWAPVAVMEIARERGISIREESGMIRCSGPKGAMTPIMAAAMRRHKVSILSLLHSESTVERQVSIFLRTWWDRHQDEPITVDDLLTLVDESSLLGEWVHSVTDHGRRTKLGTIIRRLRGRCTPVSHGEGLDMVLAVAGAGRYVAGVGPYRLVLVGWAIRGEVRI